MRLIAAASLLVAALAATASPSAGSVPLIDNGRVVVWDLTGAAAGGLAGTLDANDAVVVYLSPEAMEGKVEFLHAGPAVSRALSASRAMRMIVISLKESATAPVAGPAPNPTPYPATFPRTGSTKLLDNPRVAVWDYSFKPGTPSPMHFHDTDIVTVYLDNGALISTTPEGTKTKNEYSFGTTRFSPKNRMHTETLVKGNVRVIATEIK